MKRGRRIDEGIERFVAFPGSTQLPGTDRPALDEAGYDPLAGELAEIVGLEARAEVNDLETGLREVKALPAARGFDGRVKRAVTGAIATEP